jgi:hypothetical protein
MPDDVEVYDHAVLSPHARRLLVVLAAVAALVLGLVTPAHAANGHIVGTVTGVGAVPLADVFVDVYAIDDLDYLGGDVTDAQGQYDVAMPPGTYLLVFWPDDGEYEPELYDDIHDFDVEAATPVVVTDGGSTQADAELTRTASISGHLTKNAADPAFAVQVYDDQGNVVDWGWVEPDGSYEVNGLPAGSYRLAFNRLSGFAYSAAEFYDDDAEEAGLASADLVTLASGEARTDVDAVLVEGGHVTGTLRDNDGQPIHCKLQAFTTDHSLVTRSGWSDATTGAFDITGLTTGNYLVRVVNGQACQNGLQYVEGTGGPLGTDLAAADPVAATRGGNTALTPTLVYDLGPQPVNTVPPSISGTPVVNAVLTANHGTWSPSSHLTYHYQWLANGTEIPAATRRTYRVNGVDVGKTIAVRVTVNRGSRTATATSGATSPVVAASGSSPFPLMPVSRPIVCCAPAVNARLRALPGAWNLSGTTFRYEWSSDATVWQSGPSATFLVPEAAFGRPLTLTVIGSHAGATDYRSSILVKAKIGPGLWAHLRAPRLHGTAEVGHTLSVHPQRVKPKPHRVRFRWYRDGKVIHGARGKSYTLQQADVGHRVSVSLTYERRHFQRQVVRSTTASPVRP